MTDLSVKRTLVKSPPELWTEVSEVESLARHLGELGEISISRLEPEHTVAWEGERASGTVEIQASGWGTKVTLSCQVSGVSGQEPEPEAPQVEPEGEEPEGEPPAVETPPVTSASKSGFFARWFFRQRTEPVTTVGPPAGEEPEPALEPGPEPVIIAEPELPAPSRERQEILALLESTLDSLGAAHHRPFSRG